jgi:hypothetical protein
MLEYCYPAQATDTEKIIGHGGSIGISHSFPVIPLIYDDCIFPIDDQKNAIWNLQANPFFQATINLTFANTPT